MSAPQEIVNIELAIRVGSDPIAGSLRARKSEAHPFVGWVSLVRALDEALRDATVGGRRT